MTSEPTWSSALHRVVSILAQQLRKEIGTPGQKLLRNVEHLWVIGICASDDGDIVVHLWCTDSRLSLEMQTRGVGTNETAVWSFHVQDRYRHLFCKQDEGEGEVHLWWMKKSLHISPRQMSRQHYC